MDWAHARDLEAQSVNVEDGVSLCGPAGIQTAEYRARRILGSYFYYSAPPPARRAPESNTFDASA